MEKGNNNLLEMMSLSEEINSINTKVMQLIEDLHSRDVSESLKKLSTDLSSKVSSFSKSVNGYKPKDVETGGNNIKASHEDSSEEPMRITPTPDDIGGEYMPEPIVRKKKVVKATPAKKVASSKNPNSNKAKVKARVEERLPVKDTKKTKVTTTKKKKVAPPKPKKKQGNMFGAFSKFNKEN